MFSFVFGGRVEWLLGHVVALLLTFWGTARLFAKVVAPALAG